MSEDRPFLRAFFAAMTPHLNERPHEPESLWGAFPDWSASPKRVGIYGRFMRRTVDDTLTNLYEYCSERVADDVWTRVLDGYYPRRSAAGWEINTLGEGFPAYLAEVQARHELPAYLAELAQLELAMWTAHAVGDDPPTAGPERAVNPTLTALQSTHRVCAYVLERNRSGTPEEGPEPGDELALLWRHPESLRSRHVVAEPQHLLALKVVGERIPLEAAAEAAGVAPADLEAVLVQAEADGLISRAKTGP